MCRARFIIAFLLAAVLAPQPVDAGLFAWLAARRAAREAAFQAWFQQHFQPQPGPQPRPQPQPQPTPPAPPPPVNPSQPATPDPVTPTAAGHLWVIEVVASNFQIDYRLARLGQVAAQSVRSKGNHYITLDSNTVPVSMQDVVSRGVKDGTPRAVLVDTSRPRKTWIIGSVPIDSEANVLGHLKAYQGP